MVEESIPIRNQFGKFAVNIAFISVFVGFAAFGILGWSMMNLFISIAIDFPGSGTSLFGPIMMSMMANMAVKMFTGFIGPAIGTNIIRKQQRTLAVIYFAIIGIINMVPLLIGGSEVIETIFATIGILPFIPHMISGTLCLFAAVLVGLWVPAPGGYGVESLIRTVDHTYTSPTGKQPRCPNCGHGLFGDERYCPSCAYDLRSKKQ